MSWRPRNGVRSLPKDSDILKATMKLPRTMSQTSRSWVLEVETRNVKALYRRAQACMNQADLDLAELDIKKALEIDPNNRDVRLEYKVLKEKMKEYNEKDAQFYGNIFAKLSKIDSPDSTKEAPKAAEAVAVDSNA